MPDTTLRDIVNTFTEQELDLSVPIDFQDVDQDHFELVNNYNTYLSNGQYSEALALRNNNPDLDKYIFDAKKMNILQSMVINSYLFAKDEKSAKYTKYDDSKTNLNADNVQTAIENTNTKIESVEKKMPSEPNDVNIVVCTCSGTTDTQTTLNDGVITKINLTKMQAESPKDGNMFMELNDNGELEISERGWYLISASVYMVSNKTDGNISRSVFVNTNDGKKTEELLASTVSAYGDGSGTYGAVATATKLVKFDSSNMSESQVAKLSLHARMKNVDGYVSNGNNSTFLTVIRIGGGI